MLLQTEALAIGYGKKVIQQNLNISVHRGSLISLIGTNGAGKSTLLRTLASLQAPLSGTIKIDGHNIHQMPNQLKARLLAVVLTEKIDIDNLTVRQLVSMGRFPYTNWLGALSDADNRIIDKALADVNLSHKAESSINRISDGEKQRAVIAKALAQDTPLILLDEPTAHLDLPNRIETMLLLQRLSVSTNKTFILSTHELDLALQISDRIWLMTPSGIQTGIPEDLMLNGSFQKAFKSDNYTFDIADGRCIINNIYGNMTINLTADPDSLHRQTWLRRALTRIGIATAPNATTTIHCSANGFQLTTATDTNANATTHHTIESVISKLNTLQL